MGAEGGFGISGSNVQWSEPEAVSVTYLVTPDAGLSAWGFVEGSAAETRFSGLKAGLLDMLKCLFVCPRAADH